MWPRLVIEKSESFPETEIGYLQVSDSAQKINIGSADSAEFRLMQCLFSPRNFPSARYEPVTQTYERLFAAMTMEENMRSALKDTEERRMAEAVEISLRKLQNGSMKDYVSFIMESGKARMSIVA